MRLVLQCAMCGTLHAVGTAACSTCRAAGVTQLRLIFECPICGRLDLNPQCATCPRATPAYELVEPLDLDELVVGVEVTDEPILLDDDSKADFENLEFDLDLDAEEGEYDVELDDGDDSKLIVDLSDVFPDDSERDVSEKVDDADSILEELDDNPDEG